MNPKTLSRVMSELGKAGAAKRLARMSKEEKSEWGRKTVNARWEKKRAKTEVGTTKAT